MSLLTQEERDRFAAYLEAEAATDEGIAQQMEQAKVPDVLIRKIRAEATAARIIAAKLRSIESMQIGGSQP